MRPHSWYTESVSSRHAAWISPSPRDSRCETRRCPFTEVSYRLAMSSSALASGWTNPTRSIIDVASMAPDEDQLGRAIAEADERGMISIRTLRSRAEAVDVRAALYIERAISFKAASCPGHGPVPRPHGGRYAPSAVDWIPVDPPHPGDGVPGGVRGRRREQRRHPQGRLVRRGPGHSGRRPADGPYARRRRVVGVRRQWDVPPGVRP